jgi:Cyclo-malto-dextrinase C-terminal domain.
MKQTQSIDTERFREVLGLASVGKEVMSGTTINLKESITVPAKKAWIIEIN